MDRGGTRTDSWSSPSKNDHANSTTSFLSEALARGAAKTPVKTPTKTLPPKTRSLSDSVPTLSPSPKFKEPFSKASDDNAVLEGTPRPIKFDASARGLTLQMPARDSGPSSNSTLFGSLSPRMEARDIYGSPSSVIPRHSRGLDRARAATHLHHSTIAEQPSPESSPTVTQKGFAHSSRRTSSHSMVLDSPRLTSGWMSNGNSYAEKGLFPRSLGSTIAVNSDSSGSESDDSMEQDNPEETMIATPQVQKIDNSTAITPFGVPLPKTVSHWPEVSSPVSQAFTNFRQARRSKNAGRHSSDSTEAHSRMTTPDQPLSRESTMSGYFGRDIFMQNALSRRESLTLGTNHLHITSSNEDADESGSSGHQSGVIRRPVTRRSNLLPKSKNFARIRAALQEEGAPVDSETKREAEVVKQAFAHYSGPDWGSSTTAPPSPDLTPTIPAIPTEGSYMSDIEGLGLSTTTTTSSGSATASKPSHNTEHRRSSVQKELWSSLYNIRMQTPPPGNRARSSSGISEDMGIDSPLSSTPQQFFHFGRSNSSATDTDTVLSTVPATVPQGQILAQAPLTSAELTRKLAAGGKRRRDDDFYDTAMKRRAVSPGLSVHSSPVINASPGWGQSRQNREPSGGSVSGIAGSIEDRGEVIKPNASPWLGPKKIGLQGMTDTSDGLMKMSID